METKPMGSAIKSIGTMEDSAVESSAMETSVDSLKQLAEQSKAWPFIEAGKIVARLERDSSSKGRNVLFATGYGPSGLPHIGTFGEVARTSMVQHAFRVLTADQVPTRLICFSDDMDGLRKVPTNIPNQDMVTRHLGQPLTQIPDPFGTETSFGAHNNARLRSFLDRFGFAYEFASSTEYYQSGRFDETLLKVLATYDEIMAIMLPSLGPERQKTYAPFLPICPRSGVVLQVPIEVESLAQGTIRYIDPETHETMVTPVTGGACKLQWKVDWAMRWAALGVDYEMSGKDLIDSVKLSTKICRAIGAVPPEGFNYELFLDDRGEKISKSRGNGISIEAWLRYASPASLSLFMYQAPRKAKRLYFDVIPKQVDDYFTHLARYHTTDIAGRLTNPAWHIHQGDPPNYETPISFMMLLNLVSASNASDSDILWGFIQRYNPDISPLGHPHIGELVDFAVLYFEDFIRPHKKFRAPTANEQAALEALETALDKLGPTATAEEIQTLLYDIGKRFEFAELRDWFGALYEILLGQQQGPRFGSFIALYGVDETKTLIQQALAGKLVSDPST